MTAKPTVDDFAIGDRVRYLAPGSYGDAHFPGCLTGRVISKNSDVVYVRFAPHEEAEPVDPSDLIHWSYP